MREQHSTGERALRATRPVLVPSVLSQPFVSRPFPSRAEPWLLPHLAPPIANLSNTPTTNHHRCAEHHHDTAVQQCRYTMRLHQ